MGAHMRYGMNPHQAAEVTGGPAALNGEPSMINYLDALNASALVREADAATGLPAAASFKHVSPAGAAVAGKIDDVASETWRVHDDGGLISAYVRARDADPKSSFGDVVALSRPVDTATAEFLRSVICDAVIAPGYEEGAVALLSGKRGGRFLVFEADAGGAAAPGAPRAARRGARAGPGCRRRRDRAAGRSARRRRPPRCAAGHDRRPVHPVELRRAGACRCRDRHRAGQQNRVDCVRLAGAKARVWWLRRHAFVCELPEVAGMRRQDRLNWQIRFAGAEMTRAQRAEFAELFGAEASDRYADAGWRDAWCADLAGVTLVSDGFLPFRDNVDHAAEYGVATIVEPGGSTRTDEVVAAAAEHGITHVQTGLRLFRH
ncbi:hypothetical protein [Microbacterium sp. KUDC0406]|uniref:hypothetical protein n=1 Tax=Microbacterium sp. KUDC0406 TaxID=2909588 RepID=UPI003FA570C3